MPLSTGLIFTSTGQNEYSRIIEAVKMISNHFTVLFVLLILSLSARANDFSLIQLMNALASQPRLMANFKEEKYDNFLEIPLVSTGQVSFTAPGYLEKIIKKPSLQSFILDGDKITISIRGKESKTYSVDQRPEIRAFTESFRSTLSGDRETLEKYYDVKLTGQFNQWELQLKPINKDMSKSIETILFTGHQNQIHQITTSYRNGDKSVMSFFSMEKPDVGNE